MPTNDQKIVTDIKMHVNSTTEEFYRMCRERFESYELMRANTNYDDRQEIFQKAFITIWEKIEYGDIYVENGQVMVHQKANRDKEKGNIRATAQKVDSLVSFFSGTAFNKYREFLRQHGREVPTDIFPDNLEDDNGEEYFSNLMDIVDHAIKDMPKHCREIISMVYLEGLSLNEILQRRKNSSYNGLKNGKAKCMKKIRDYIHSKKAA